MVCIQLRIHIIVKILFGELTNIKYNLKESMQYKIKLPGLFTVCMNCTRL